MSPRAAWQLESLGFERVYHFVAGKIEWLSQGLPTEGTGPHYATAAEALRRDVPTCLFSETAGDVRRVLRASSEDFCIVVNERNVVLGRVRAKELPEDDGIPAHEFMRPGPATVRPTEELRPLLERMQRAGVSTILVTTERGRLLGVVHRADAERALGPLA